NAPPKVALMTLNTIRARHHFGRVGFLPYLTQIPEKLGTEFSYPGTARDILFEASYDHERDADDCTNCRVDRVVQRSIRVNTNPAVHYGIIASRNGIIRDGSTRERLRRKHNIMCFE